MENKCTKCGELNDSANYTNIVNIEYCFNCNYWNAALFGNDFIVMNGVYYVDAGWKEKGLLGFGGRVFKYRKLGSDEIITTNNMWNGSKIPEVWAVPDNAEMVC